MKSADDSIYKRIIECLHRFGQGKLANKLVDINEELVMLNESKFFFINNKTFHATYAWYVECT